MLRKIDAKIILKRSTSGGVDEIREGRYRTKKKKKRNEAKKKKNNKKKQQKNGQTEGSANDGG